MKLKFCLLFLLIVFSLENTNAAIIRDTRSGKTVIQPKQSSIVKTNVYDNLSSSDYKGIAKELENKLSYDSQNYSLYVPLVESYMKSKNHQAAFDTLNKILEIKESGELPSSVVKQLSDLKTKTILNTRYSKDKSSNYINLAIMSLIQGNNLQAEQYIKTAVPNVSDPDLLSEAIKVVFDKTNNKNEAVAVCNLYSSLVKDDSNIKKSKILYLLQSGNLSAALKEYNNLRDNMQDDVDSKTKYEFYKKFKERNADDKEIIKNIYGERITLEEGYNNLYYLLSENGDKQGAGVYAGILKKEFPKSFMSNMIAAQDLLNQGKSDEAKDLMENIRDKITNEDEITEYNNTVAYLNKGSIQEAVSLFNQGYYKEALKMLETCQNIDQNATIISLQGRCYLELGNNQKALECFNKAYALEPNMGPVLFQFANYYYVNGDYSTAEKYFEQAKNAEIKPDQSLMDKFEKKLNAAKAETYINKISDLIDAQNYKEAMTLVNKALKIDNDSSMLHFYKGIIYISQNNYAASTAELYKSIELDKNSVLPYYYLALAFDNLGEPQNALSYYKKFLEVLPDDYYGESETVNYAKSRINKLQK